MRLTALRLPEAAGERSGLMVVEGAQTELRLLVEILLRRVRANFVVISGLPPLHLTPVAPQPLRWYMGRYARLLDNHLRQWISPQQNFAYVSLQWASDIGELAEDGYHSGERQYSVWANLVATQIGDLLSMR